MTFAPLAPTITVAPTEVAPDTFVIHQVQEALGQPLFVYINSMVIRGREPMIVENPADPRNRRVSITLLYRKAPNGFRESGGRPPRGMTQPRVDLPARPDAAPAAPARKTASGH